MNINGILYAIAAALFFGLIPTITKISYTFGANPPIAIISRYFIASLIIWGLIKSTVGIRVTDEEESNGLDVTDCGMEAYPEFTK